MQYSYEFSPVMKKKLKVKVLTVLEDFLDKLKVLESNTSK